jgi:CBS domain-containing protein
MLKRTSESLWRRQGLALEKGVVVATVQRLLLEKGSEVWSIAPSSSVFEAIKLMAEKGIGALVVLENGKLVGMLSERDYARKVILKGKSSRETQVGEIMTEDVITVSPETTIEGCMRLMTDHRVRHLPVMEEGKLIGIISIGDVVKAIISQQEFFIEQLQNYIAGR